jgi:hypothetical protein
VSYKNTHLGVFILQFFIKTGSMRAEYYSYTGGVMVLQRILSSHVDDNRKKKEEEAKTLFVERIRYSLEKKNTKERRDFVDALKVSGVDAMSFMRLAQEVSTKKGKDSLSTWERKVAKQEKLTTLRDVHPRSAFSKIIIVLRHLYAEDIADDISFETAVTIAIEEVLLHP